MMSACNECDHNFDSSLFCKCKCHRVDINKLMEENREKARS